MALRTDFLDAVEDYLRRTGQSASAVNTAACGHNKVVARLRGGGNVSARTMEKLMAYMSRGNQEDAVS